MSNIQTEINRLTQAKTDIKGVLDRLSVSYESDKLDSLALAIGSIKKVEAKQENGVITIPAGYISEEQTFVVSSDLTTGYLINGADGNVYFQAVKEVDGEIVADGDPVKVEGIEIPDTGVDAPSPVYPLPEADIVTGYIINNEDGSVYFQRVKEVDGEITNDGDPVLISEANIPETGVDEPGYVCDTQGGFQLAKVTEYTPYRAELTAPEKVVISGMGTVESEGGDSADFSDVNGTYTVTDDTKYISGLKRVYKQAGGNYYLRGYDPDDYEYPEFGAYWCITQYTSNSRWDAKAVFDSENIPSGTNTWYSEMMGNVSIPTEVTNITYPEQPLVLTGQKVNAYDPATRSWDIEESVSAFEGFESTPIPDFIFAHVDRVFVGQYVSFVNEFIGKQTKFALDASDGAKELISGTIPTEYNLSNGEFVFDNSLIKIDASGIDGLNIGKGDFTIEFDFTITNNRTGIMALYASRSDWYPNTISVQWARYGYLMSLHWNGVEDGIYNSSKTFAHFVSDGKYHHCAVVRKDSNVTMYIDGESQWTRTITADVILNTADTMFGRWSDFFPGKMKHFKISSNAIYIADFRYNIPAWVGK